MAKRKVDVGKPRPRRSFRAMVWGLVVLFACMIVLASSLNRGAQQASSAATANAASLDFAALEATSVAISEPIKLALEKQPDLQGVRSVSSMWVGDGWSITIEANVAPADDNEFTMPRLLEIVQQQVQEVTQVRVNTYLDNQPQRLWLWENGNWTVAVVGQ